MGHAWPPLAAWLAAPTASGCAAPLGAGPDPPAAAPQPLPHPQLHGRRHCEEEVIYLPCEKKCDRKPIKWWLDDDKYWCGE